MHNKFAKNLFSIWDHMAFQVSKHYIYIYISEKKSNFVDHQIMELFRLQENLEGC